MTVTERADIAFGDFDIQFNHDRVVWETGTASGAPPGGLGGQSALVGYWTSATSNATLPGSLVNGALLDSGPAGTSLIRNSLTSTVLGQYNFQVRGGAVQPPTGVPEPMSLALVGLAIAGMGLVSRKKRTV